MAAVGTAIPNSSLTGFTDLVWLRASAWRELALISSSRLKVAVEWDSGLYRMETRRLET